jgi:uncharacterized protein (DUF2141 family)
MKYLFFFITIIYLLTACADIVSPDGGEPDKTPPKCIEITPANQSVNFFGKEIKLQFDENVQLRNKTSVVVSPSIATPPEFVERNTQIIVRLPDSLLQKSTTYTINFADNITDITENNALKGFTYVFSTGSFLDSLQLAGTVQEAFTTQKLPNIVVGLYNIEDSIINQKPLYFTKTDKDGNFLLQNLRTQPYQIIAFDDKAADNKPQTAEPIAFLDSAINIKTKTATANLRLCLLPKPAPTDIKPAPTDTAQLKPNQQGTLILTNCDTLQAKNFVVQLLNAQNDVVYTQKIAEKTTTFTQLKPETYRLRLYIDANKNNILDATNFLKKQQPEVVYLLKDALKIRANWELEQDIKKVFEQ